MIGVFGDLQTLYSIGVAQQDEGVVTHKYAFRFNGEEYIFFPQTGITIIPTVGDIAPLRSASSDALEEYRGRCFSLLCVAGLAGLPQLSLPVARYQGAPVGLSLIGPVGFDTSLIAIAKNLSKIKKLFD